MRVVYYLIELPTRWYHGYLPRFDSRFSDSLSILHPSECEWFIPGTINPDED
jgi:hypothetical protein